MENEEATFEEWWASLSDEWKHVIRQNVRLAELSKTFPPAGRRPSIWATLDEKVDAYKETSAALADPLVDAASVGGLTKIECFGVPVNDISPLERLALEEVYLGDTNIASLSALRPQTLRKLCCFGAAVQDLSELYDAAHLENLCISSTKVQDLEPLRGCTSLRKLSIYNTAVASLKPLYGLTNLELVRCHRTNVDAQEASRLLEALPNCRVSLSEDDFPEDHDDFA